MEDKIEYKILADHGSYQIIEPLDQNKEKIRQLKRRSLKKKKEREENVSAFLICLSCMLFMFLMFTHYFMFGY